MRRREFIGLLGGATTWPLAARAQQPDRMRRIDVLMNLPVDDPEAQVRVAAFPQRLEEWGWSANVAIDYRWAPAMPTATAYAAESEREQNAQAA